MGCGGRVKEVEVPITVFDDFKLYIAAFIGGILIGALIYRELEKRFFRERSTPLSVVIEQSVIRDKVTTLMKLARTLTKTVDQIQYETEIIIDQLSRMQDMEESAMGYENELTSSLRELSKIENEGLEEKSEKSTLKVKEYPRSPLEQPASELEEIATALRNLFESK